MDLFVTPPKIDPKDYGLKTASYKISSPPGYWDDEVAQLLVREHPYIPSDQVVVTFKKRDDAAGTAFGFASISGNPKVSIPIIIRRRELAPMDVMIIRTNPDGDTVETAGDMSEDQVQPLNDETFSKAMEVGTVGQPILPHQDRSSGYTEDGNSLRLPFRGRTVISSLMGASPAKMAEFEAALKDKKTVAGFMMNGTSSVVDAWLNAGECKKTAQANVGATPVNQTIAKFATVVPRELNTADFMAADVVATDGTVKTAVAVDTIDLASPSKGLQRVLLFEDGTYANAPAKVAGFAGNEDELTARVIEKVSSGELRRGATLMFQAGEHFTRPAKLASITASDSENVVKLRMNGDLGQAYDIYLNKSVKQATLVGAEWVLPMASKVFQLNDYAEQPAMPLEKVAEWFDRNLPDTLTCADGQYTLAIRGETFGASQVSDVKVAEVLDSWFVNGKELLDHAKEFGHVRFASELPGQIAGLAKLAEKYDSLPVLAKEAIADLGMDMAKAVKLAAALGDPDGVDSVLSAGFLSEDNLSEFANLADSFEEVVGKLARLLCAVRMGFPGDENATMVAMKSLQRVSERLRAASQQPAE